MQGLKFLFKQILNENPNQAIKFLKDRRLDPTITPKGKQILDSILNFTKGDGYTFLLTQFHVNEKMPLNELQKLHEFLKANKPILTRLPKPVVTYETYRSLVNDITDMQTTLTVGWLLKQLSPQLREEGNNLGVREKLKLAKIAENFKALKPEKQKHFLKKAFAYKSIKEFMFSIKSYIEMAKSELDYNGIKMRVESTPDAFIVYDDSENNIFIVHINSFDAMKTLGCTSAWCITKDMARYRQYKKGKVKYFFIWDFNYAPKSPDFFIATAYNPNNPEKSSTHEHIADASLNLNEVLEAKHLSFDIFNNYIRKFNSERFKNRTTESALMQAFENNDQETILKLIEDSKTIFKFGHGKKSPQINWDEQVYLGLSEDEMKEMLELGDDFDYIARAANNSNYGDYYSDDEGNYMHSGLSSENMKLIIEIAKKMGVPKSEYNKFKEEEGAISTFLNSHGMEGIVGDYISEYGSAQEVAESNAANDLMSEMPFDVYDGSFKIDEMMEYMMDNEIVANNFDELITYIKDILPSFSYDSISESRYMDVDLDELNRVIKNQLENILDDIDNDEDNPYFNKAISVKTATEELGRMGFTILDNGEAFAELKLKSGTITVTDVTARTQDDGKVVVYVTVDFEYKPNAKMKNRKIKVPITSLKNYISQLELPLKEHLSLLKLISI